MSSTHSEASTHATNALCRGRARDARRRADRARLDLARRRSGAAPVLRRPRPVCGWAAPRDRYRRRHRIRRSRAGGRQRLLRGLASAGWAGRDDPDRRRLLGHAAPARRDHGHAGRRGDGGGGRGPERVERRPRDRRAPRPPGPSPHRRPGGLRRPARAAPCAGGGAGRCARAGARPRGCRTADRRAGVAAGSRRRAGSHGDSPGGCRSEPWARPGGGRIDCEGCAGIGAAAARAERGCRHRRGGGATPAANRRA